MDLTRGLYFSVCVNNNYDFDKKKKKQVHLPPETTLKGPINYWMVNLTVLFSWGSQANKLASSANKMSSAQFRYAVYIIYTQQEKQEPKMDPWGTSHGGPFVERSSGR